MEDKRDREYKLAQNKLTNRKVKTTSGTFEYDGVAYEVNATGSGIYKEIMRRIIEQLRTALEIHKRLLVIRFDLHSASFDHGNEEIRLFRKRIITWVSRHYQTHSIGFVWARETESAKAQHYHLAMFIDGDKVRNPKKILSIIMQKWELTNPSNHHMPHIKKPYYFIDNDDVLADAVYRLSYLAKTRGKGYRPKQVKDYSTSRLKLVQ